MKEQKPIISKSDYEKLLYKVFDGQTLFEGELDALKAFEDDLRLKSGQDQDQGPGIAYTRATKVGRALVEDEYRQAGVASAILIVIGVITFGIIAATLLIKL